MSKEQLSPASQAQPYRYASPNIPFSAIKRFARQIAEKFQPSKIILFGSYAYGTPHSESDVDLLVIMPCRNTTAQAIRIYVAFQEPFSLDVIVRTPYQMRQALKDPTDCDWFLREITEKGKVLYEAPHPAWVRKAEQDMESAKTLAAKSKPPHEVVGFHCQQAAEKYLKALLQERGASIQRTHNLIDLLNRLLVINSALAPLKRGLKGLTRFAVEYRYPGRSTNKREMESALRTAERVRTAIRTKLGLPL